MKIIKMDNNSISSYFKIDNRYYFADLSNVYGVYIELMIFKCSQRGVVDYNNAVYCRKFDELSEKNLIIGVKHFKSF